MSPPSHTSNQIKSDFLSPHKSTGTQVSAKLECEFHKLCREQYLALIKKIVATSEGNPFFIENIVRSLVDSNILVKNANGKIFVSKSIKNINIPSSMQHIILAQWNALGFEEQVICKTAAVIGRSFSSDILRILMPEAISDFTYKKALSNFKNHNLILPEPNRDNMYFFKHMSIRNVIYDTMIGSTRRELNSQLLSYLEKEYADNIFSIVERLVYHAQESVDYDKIYKYATLAATKAEKQYALEDTINQYHIALEASKKMDEKPSMEELQFIQMQLANAYRKKGDYKKATSLYIEILKQDTKKITSSMANQADRKRVV